LRGGYRQASSQRQCSFGYAEREGGKLRDASKHEEYPQRRGTVEHEYAQEFECGKRNSKSPSKHSSYREKRKHIRIPDLFPNISAEEFSQDRGDYAKGEKRIPWQIRDDDARIRTAPDSQNENGHHGNRRSWRSLVKECVGYVSIRKMPFGNQEHRHQQCSQNASGDCGIEMMAESQKGSPYGSQRPAAGKESRSGWRDS
jgi:hypothetical protein